MTHKEVYGYLWGISFLWWLYILVFKGEEAIQFADSQSVIPKNILE